MAEVLTLKPRRRCADCAYVLQYTPPGQLKGSLLCRRFPPAVAIVSIQTLQGPVPGTQNLDRPVGGDYWCHEFKRRPVLESGEIAPPDEESGNAPKK